MKKLNTEMYQFKHAVVVAIELDDPQHLYLHEDHTKVMIYSEDKNITSNYCMDNDVIYLKKNDSLQTILDWAAIYQIEIGSFEYQLMKRLVTFFQGELLNWYNRLDFDVQNSFFIDWVEDFRFKYHTLNMNSEIILQKWVNEICGTLEQHFIITTKEKEDLLQNSILMFKELKIFEQHVIEPIIFDINNNEHLEDSYSSLSELQKDELIGLWFSCVERSAQNYESLAYTFIKEMKKITILGLIFTILPFQVQAEIESTWSKIIERYCLLNKECEKSE